MDIYSILYVIRIIIAKSQQKQIGCSLGLQTNARRKQELGSIICLAIGDSH